VHDIRLYVPELFNEKGTLLYIGARKDAHSWLDELYQAEQKITILEIWPQNIDFLINDHRIQKIIKGDVRKIKEISKRNKYDYVFWWHGPEHINKEELSKTIMQLEEITNKTIAMASSWGIYIQGPHKGNPYEEHLSHLSIEDFSLLGYNTATDGLQNEPGSEIVAWKRIGEIP